MKAQTQRRTLNAQNKAIDSKNSHAKKVLRKERKRLIIGKWQKVYIFN